jgi:hypothetical protein
MKLREKANNRIECIFKAKRGRKRYDAQMASVYILYMMLGSEFERCVFASSAMEERLRFEYMKMPLDDQYGLEERIIDWIEAEQEIRMYEDIRSKVYTYQEGISMGVRFETYFGAIELLVDRDGSIFQ